MIFFLYKNLNISKIKAKPLRMRRFSRQKWAHDSDPKMHPKMTQNTLQIADLATFPKISKIMGDDLWFF